MNSDYNKNLKEYARALRKESVSLAEQRLWKRLLSKGRMGVKFKRQRPINNYIVDFFAQEIKLIIEIDGNAHLNNGKYDFRREEILKNLGYQVLRFSEGKVINQLDDVHRSVAHAVYCLKNDLDLSVEV
jgi:very-short-patch-repair endonuclease